MANARQLPHVSAGCWLPAPPPSPLSLSLAESFAFCFCSTLPLINISQIFGSVMNYFLALALLSCDLFWFAAAQQPKQQK